MPTVPTKTEAAVSTAPLRLPFQSTAVPAGAFGQDRAAALSDLAQAQLGNAEAMNRIALRTQIEDNEREAKKLDIQFSEQLRLLGMGDGSAENPGFYDTRGEITLQSAPAVKKGIEEARRKMMEGVQNVKVREMFSLASAARAEQELQSVDVHTAKERRTANDTASDARMKEASDDVAAQPFNEVILGRSLSIATGEVGDKSQRKGWSPEVTASKMQEAQSLILRNAIISGMKQDAIAAQELYNKFEGHIDGELRAGIEELLENATVDQHSQNAADAIMALPLTDAEARRNARAIENPKVRDATLVRVNQRIAERSAEETEQMDEIEDTLYQHVWGGGKFSDWEREHPEAAQVARKNNSLMTNLRNAEDAVSAGRSFARVTDPITQTELELLPVEELARINPLAYKHKFTQAEYGSLLDKIRGARASVEAAAAKDPKEHTVYSRGEAALKDFAPLSINWGSAKQDDDQRRVQHTIQHQMNSWVEGQLGQGNTPTVPELSEKASGLMTRIQGDTNWAWFFGGFEATIGELPTLTPEQRKVAFVAVEDIQPALLETIKASLARRNIPESDELIGRIAFSQLAGDAALQRELLQAPEPE